MSALNVFFHLELIVCKIVLCCLFQMFPYFLTFQMGKLWVRSQMSSVWCCCLSWRSPVDGGTGFCAALEIKENLAQLINSLFGWDLFGLVTSCVEMGQNSTPKHHCPHVRSVSKMSIIVRTGKKQAKLNQGMPWEQQICSWHWKLLFSCYQCHSKCHPSTHPACAPRDKLDWGGFGVNPASLGPHSQVNWLELPCRVVVMDPKLGEHLHLVLL